MRISADPKSLFHSPQAYHATVYLDGELLNNCITADDVAGTAECYMLDSAGRLVVTGDEVERVTLMGRVTIILRDMNFDAWMRRRRDAAHAAFMERTRNMGCVRLELEGMI